MYYMGSMLPLGINLTSLGMAYFEPTWFRWRYASKYVSIVNCMYLGTCRYPVGTCRYLLAGTGRFNVLESTTLPVLSTSEIVDRYVK